VTAEDVAALRPWVLAYTKRRVPRNDVEDVAQEVLLQALQSLPSFVSSSRSQAGRRWIAGIARHAVAMYWRAVRNARRYERDLRPQYVPSPEERWGAIEELTLLQASMTPERWRALVAAEDGGTIREIAEAEGVEVHTVNWWLRCAREDIGAAKPHSSPSKKSGMQSA